MFVYDITNKNTWFLLDKHIVNLYTVAYAYIYF